MDEKQQKIEQLRGLEPGDVLMTTNTDGIRTLYVVSSLYHYNDGTFSVDGMAVQLNDDHTPYNMTSKTAHSAKYLAEQDIQILKARKPVEAPEAQQPQEMAA